MEINFEKLKEAVQWHMEDARKYQSPKEDLRMLKIQIMGLADTFQLITEEQAKELMEPVLTAMEACKN